MIFKPRIFAFICFILSGVASVSYQLLWLRDAISRFGVITPVISVLLSIFMLGLAIGTYAAGQLTQHLSTRKALLYYALIELGISTLAINTPHLFDIGYNFLLGYASLESTQYLVVCSLIIATTLLPACILIGTTLPLMMKILEHYYQNQKNFGVLYFANLIGALIGCVFPLILIEVVGVHATLQITTLLNLSTCLIASIFLYATHRDATLTDLKSPTTAQTPDYIATKYKAFLFLTGFVAIGSELLWVKAFTPVTSSNVYAFAIVLGTYLCANIAGNSFYLRTASDLTRVKALLLMPFCALLIVFATVMWALSNFSFLMVASIIPLSFLFGYLTPHIIDKSCNGKPHLTAQAYTYNFAGCILGPLCTGYILFPLLGLKLSFIIHAAILVLAVLLLLSNVRKSNKLIFCTLFLMLSVSSLATVNYEDYARKNGVVYRDRIGYVAATGEGMKKQLTVNGIGMTSLTTITKNMVNLPAAYHTKTPNKILIICMGMGTTLRSATNWPFNSITMVELSSAVIKTFPYFHHNAQAVLDDKRVKIVIDDGRRFLTRNKEKYDIITLDPPPPMEASGSGLLYSTDFMALIAARLNEGGILANWIPNHGNTFLTQRILAAMMAHFKYIKIFKSIEGWGIHILASNNPIPSLTTQQYIDKLPARAKTDLMEYHRGVSLDSIAQNSLHEVNLKNFIPDLEKMPPPLSDDRLYNEFYLLHRIRTFLRPTSQ